MVSVAWSAHFCRGYNHLFLVVSEPMSTEVSVPVLRQTLLFFVTKIVYFYTPFNQSEHLLRQQTHVGKCLQFL